MWRHLTLLLAASCFTFLLGLGRAAIGDSDEAFYAEAAREMVESGDWLTPHYNYEFRFQKPILYYWLAAAAFMPTGPGEAAARLPAALAGVMLVLTTWWCGRRWYDERTSFLAGLITASNFGYFAMGRQALPDLPLAAFMTLATWAGLEAAERYGRSPAADRAPVLNGWLAMAAIGGALAFLMKGPVGLALPLLIVLIATRAGLVGRPRWLPVPASALAVAAVLFVLVAAPWFVAMAREHGVSYLHRFFVAENVERFATDRYNEPRSPLFYVPIVFGGLAPWSPFLLLWIPDLRRAIRERRMMLPPRGLMMAIWAAVPFIFYSLSVGKQPRYILPILPPLAILMADAIARRLQKGSAGGPRRMLPWLGTVAGLLFVTLGVLLLRATPLLAALAPSTTRAAAVLIIAGGILVAVIAWVRANALSLVLGLTAVATFLALHYSVFSARGFEPVQRMAVPLLAAKQGDQLSGTHRVFVRNLIFYTGVRQTDLPRFDDLATFLGQPDRVLCVLRQSDLERLQRERGMHPRVLSSISYINTAGLRLKSLLWPNPERDLDTVHLVTNH